MKAFLFHPLRLCVSAVIFAVTTSAQTLAPGGPGKDAQWMTAAKQAIGTSASTTSKVWFTLANGVLTEVYYPDVTTANVQMLQFVVYDPKTKKVQTELNDADPEIEIGNNPLSFTQINTAKDQTWRIIKDYTVDPLRNVVLINIDFGQTLLPVVPGSDPKEEDLNLELYIYYDPSLANSGMHDSGWSQGGALVASDGNKFSALVSKTPFENATNGFLGTSDALSQLQNSGKIESHDRAINGNIVQFAKLTERVRRTLPIWSMAMHSEYQIALGFGKSVEDTIRSAKASLSKGFNRCRREYERNWMNYVQTLPKVESPVQQQFNMAAMVLKAHEDKTHPGANIASLSIPWGGGENANENTVGGYHLVWSRDLYHVATAYMALGDKAAANRALDFLFNVQQKPDGSFPQNSWLDGWPFWNSLQMDEVAYPLILAYQLGRFDKPTYETHIKKAANFIVKNGPATPQERWEEEGGYSPSTIAAEIAGLVCAAEIAKRNGDLKSADLWLKTADDWQANVEKWTATTTGKYGDGNYYLRITQKGRPDAGDKIEINNGAGTFDERDIVDAGFLELVRLGVKPADDPLIVRSLKVIDQLIRVDTPNGEGFYRYNHDGYGEEYDGRRWNWDGKYTGKGHLWPLLSGERGEYELARCKLIQDNAQIGSVVTKGEMCAPFVFAVKARLNTMMGFANDGLMIPEQVWDKKEVPKITDHQFVPDLKFGEGTGSATPLAWSTAQFIRLALNLKAGRNLETPDVVFNRYVLSQKH